jgi:hypothetical protein
MGTRPEPIGAINTGIGSGGNLHAWIRRKIPSPPLAAWPRGLSFRRALGCPHQTSVMDRQNL